MKIMKIMKIMKNSMHNYMNRKYNIKILKNNNLKFSKIQKKEIKILK